MGRIGALPLYTNILSIKDSRNQLIGESAYDFFMYRLYKIFGKIKFETLKVSQFIGIKLLLFFRNLFSIRTRIGVHNSCFPLEIINSSRRLFGIVVPVFCRDVPEGTVTFDVVGIEVFRLASP